MAFRGTRLYATLGREEALLNKAVFDDLVKKFLDKISKRRSDTFRGKLI